MVQTTPEIRVRRLGCQQKGGAVGADRAGGVVGMSFDLWPAVGKDLTANLQLRRSLWLRKLPLGETSVLR